ncbi:MAG TPA: GNAT family N-acetyltransferase [Lactobacillaceae bacterium]|jgi:ribosomal protein S18 acetylase RimI-like enzyme
MTTTFLRRAVAQDLPAIMPLIEAGRAFLATQKIDQWQNAYPASADIAADIAQNVGYVLVVDQQIAGYTALIIGEETAYTNIEQGAWERPQATDYAALHRIAMSQDFRGQGLTRLLFNSAFTLLQARGIFDVRVDTHPENTVMQHVLTKQGFVKRGVVQFEGARWAYQLLLA